MTIPIIFLNCFVISSRSLSEKNTKDYIFFAEIQHHHRKNTESLFFIQKHASWLILAHHLNKLNPHNTLLR